LIVRVNFKGVVLRGTKKLAMRDHVDIHTGSIKGVDVMFKRWCEKSAGVRGDSGIFHPTGKDGTIVVTSIEEVTAM
jgi:hypothetical protein